MIAPADPGLATLDRSGEPWLGHAHGLGTVRVYADGRYDVEPAEGADARAAETLEHGWAELLGHIRLGRRIVGGTVMLAPDAADSLLVSGGMTEQSQACVLLAERGWRRVSDGFTPIDTTTPLRAYRRGGPWLVPRRLGLDSDLLDGRRIRPGATAQEVPTPPVPESVPLRARVLVSEHEATTGEPVPVLAEVSGRRRMGVQFQAFADRFVGGAADPARVMADDLAISSLPLSTLQWPALYLAPRDERLAAVDALVDWWRGLNP